MICSLASGSFTLLLQRPDPEKQFEYLMLVDIRFAYVCYIFLDRRALQRARSLFSYFFMAFIFPFLTLKTGFLVIPEPFTN